MSNTREDVKALFKRIPSFEQFLDKKGIKEDYIHNVIFSSMDNINNIKSYKDDYGGYSIINASFEYSRTPQGTDYWRSISRDLQAFVKTLYNRLEEF